MFFPKAFKHLLQFFLFLSSSPFYIETLLFLQIQRLIHSQNLKNLFKKKLKIFKKSSKSLKSFKKFNKKALAFHIKLIQILRSKVKKNIKLMEKTWLNFFWDFQRTRKKKLRKIEIKKKQFIYFAAGNGKFSNWFSHKILENL